MSTPILCVLGAMGAGRIFFPDGPTGFLVGYLLVSYMASCGFTDIW